MKPVESASGYFYMQKSVERTKVDESTYRKESKING